MKEKLIVGAISLITTMSAVAGDPLPPMMDSTPNNLPEPSTLGLFAAAAIAITVMTKLKK